jgi:hypothetical protein
VVLAGLSGYGTRWDRLTLGGVTVPHLLLIDATLGAVAIMVAAWIVVRSARRDRLSQRHGEVAGLAGEGTALGEMTVVPGLSEAGMDPDPGVPEPDPGVPELDPDVQATDPGAREPAGLEQAPSQVSGVAEPDPDVQATDPGAREPAGLEQAPSQVSVVAGADPAEDDPDPGVPEPARPEQAPAQLNGVAGAGPGAHAPAAEPGGQPGAAGTVNSSGRLYSYYDGADQPVADYLAELGWSEESGARNWG